MSSTWDLPSTAFSWVMAGVGIALTALAAAGCHSSQTAATVCMLVAALTTVQLLGFAVTCLSYRSWLATSITAPRLGPGQQEPSSRRGMPALKSARGAAGVDRWSVLIVALVAVPILVPLLSFYKPSQYIQWRTAQQEPMRATTSDNFNANGAPDYTVGAYESITMSLQATVTGRGNITMANTADIAVDRQRKRVYLPSRVTSACKHEEVQAKGLKALVGQYACTSTIYNNNAAQQMLCNGTDSFTETVNQDNVCVELQNATDAAHPAPQQFMMVRHNDMQVNCSVTFGIATVDVTWRGVSKQRARLCHIAKLEPHGGDVDFGDSVLKHRDLTTKPRLLILPLVNSFMHTVDHNRISSGSTREAIELFYGSIFAAATAIRSVSKQFDPARANATGAVQVQYSGRLCQRYGWSSGLAVFLLVANVVLASCCTLLCSGVTFDKLTELVQDGCSPARSLCCRSAAARATKPVKHVQLPSMGPGPPPHDGSARGRPPSSLPV